MSQDKTAWISIGYYHSCNDSTKKNIPVYELQHQMMEHYCIQTASTHYTISVHATILCLEASLYATCSFLFEY